MAANKIVFFITLYLSLFTIQNKYFGISIGMKQILQSYELKPYIEDGLSIHYLSGRSRSPSRGYFLIEVKLVVSL